MTVAEKTKALHGDNAFALLAFVSRECRRRNIDAQGFMSEATAGDYDNLMSVADKYAEMCDAIDAHADVPTEGAHVSPETFFSIDTDDSNADEAELEWQQLSASDNRPPAIYDDSRHDERQDYFDEYAEYDENE